MPLSRVMLVAVYLITGAAGFIGANFIYFLLNQEPMAEIIALDNLSFASNITNLTQVREKIEFIAADITDRESLEKIYRTYHPDYVVNFAAESHNDRAIIDPTAFMRSNALGAQVLLDVSRCYPVQHHVHISTIEVYGELAPGNMSFTEASPLNAKTPYSAAKAAGDHIVRAYMLTYPDMRISLTHCANNYGPYQLPEKFIPLAVTNILRNKTIPLYGDGLQMRDWLHVSDHCRAIYHIIHAAHVEIPAEAAYRPELLPIYDISATEEHTNLEIAQIICDVLGVKTERIEFVPDRPNHDRRYLIDPAKIHQTLAWQARVNFRQGLQDTIQWYKENDMWWKQILQDKGELGINW